MNPKARPGFRINFDGRWIVYDESLPSEQKQLSQLRVTSHNILLKMLWKVTHGGVSIYMYSFLLKCAAFWKCRIKCTKKIYYMRISHIYGYIHLLFEEMISGRKHQVDMYKYSKLVVFGSIIYLLVSWRKIQN